MSNILKTIGKGTGKGVGTVAEYSFSTIGALIGAIWETTGTRGAIRETLEECSDSELIEINNKQSGEDGDFDLYMLSKSILNERGYTFNDNTKKWQNKGA